MRPLREVLTSLPCILLDLANELDALRLHEALQLVLELDNTLVGAAPAGRLHLAVVAQEPVAGLV